MKDTLEDDIARMERELAEMREKLERKKRNWPEELEAGMVFQHMNGAHYMTRYMRSNGNELDLVRIDGVTAGKHWRFEKLFEGKERDFTYIGLAKDVLRIEAK